MRTLLNFVLFQAGWFACVIGAGEGISWLPLAATTALLVVHLSFVVGDGARELRLLAAVTVGGSVLSAFNVANGAVRFAPGLFEVAGVPVWIVCLWALFATLLRHSLAWLRGRPALAALAGLIGSPLSYSAAAGLGAVAIHPEFARGPLVLGLTWAVAVPAAVAVAGCRR